MGIRKDIEIDGKMIAFKASAAIPRIYRLKFQRDIYKDLSVLEKSNTFSIYQILPQLIELWGLNVKTDVEAKKTSPNRA